MFLQAVVLSIALLSAVNGKPDPRIIGGAVVDIGDAPYQASIRYLGQHMCGGVILNENTILTAASCVVGMKKKFLSVRVGSSNKQGGGQEIPVDSMVQHTEFNILTKDFDIAALKLEIDIEFSFEAFSIQMAEKNDAIPVGDDADVTGWGTTIEAGAKQNELMGTKVPVISNAVCSKNYGNGRITSNMICAGSEGKGFCNQDIGGPLVYNNKLIGIASWSIGCARENLPGVYANIGALRDFIDAQ